MDIFQVLFYQPTFNLMVIASNIFGNIGWGIIFIALISKLITLPMTRNQIKNAEKSKQLQVKMKELRSKYKHNEEKLAQEMAKLQAQVLPGQLGGCLSLIIFIVLFIQVRGVILDLVNRGWYAFDQVAYTESLKKPQDSVKYILPTALNPGKHVITLNVAASNGSDLNKTYQFEVVADKTKRVDELKTEINALPADQKQALIATDGQTDNAERITDISIYNKALDSSKTAVVLSQFLIFATESKQEWLLTDNNPDLTFYIRPPSNQTIDYSKLNFTLDGTVLTDNVTYTKGDKLNLSFAGTNLSRVANDFDILDLSVTWPYILFALISGVTQYFVTKLYSAGSAATTTTEDLKDQEKARESKEHDHKKKQEEEKPDFAETMAQSTQQMNYIFPAITVLMSLGYLGGASFIPMGVTLFWTAQNGFVIIQQMISQRDRVQKDLEHRWSKWQKIWGGEPESKHKKTN